MKKAFLYSSEFNAYRNIIPYWGKGDLKYEQCGYRKILNCYM